MSYPAITLHFNEHGTWEIERIKVNGRLRYKLWLWVDEQMKWVLVANQGRRKTCIELADANYRGGLD